MMTTLPNDLIFEIGKQIEELDKHLIILQSQNWSIQCNIQEARAKTQLCCHGLYALSALLVCSGLTMLCYCNPMAIVTFVLILGYFIADCVMMWAVFKCEEDWEQISQEVNEKIGKATLLKLELEKELEIVKEDNNGK